MLKLFNLCDMCIVKQIQVFVKYVLNFHYTTIPITTKSPFNFPNGDFVTKMYTFCIFEYNFSSIVYDKSRGRHSFRKRNCFCRVFCG